jgi:transcriptional regulator with XRE-family HTH domain
MKTLDVSRSRLAERIHAKPAFVTKLLRGDNNFTAETMAKIGRALKAGVRIHLEPDGMDSEWLDFLKKEPNWNPSEPKPTELNKKSFQKIQTSEVTTHDLIAA